MHYQDGQEVKLGDICKGVLEQYARPGIEMTGIVTAKFPGCETCNVSVAFAQQTNNLSSLDAPGTERTPIVMVSQATKTAKELNLVARKL